MRQEDTERFQELWDETVAAVEKYILSLTDEELVSQDQHAVRWALKQNEHVDYHFDSGEFEVVRSEFYNGCGYEERRFFVPLECLYE